MTDVYTPKARHTDGTIPELRDRDWLHEMVHERMLSHRQIGEILGCTQSNVTKWCNVNKIERRPLGWDKACTNPLLQDDGWLRVQYVDVGRTLQSIAREVGCSEDKLRERFAEIDVHTRGRLTAVEIEKPEWEDYPQRLHGPLNKTVICYYVARWYNVDAELVGKRDDSTSGVYGAQKFHATTGQLWHARRVAIWLVRRLLNHSTGLIADEFNYTASSAVNRSFKKIDTYIKSCPAYAEEVRRLTQDITERR